MFEPGMTYRVFQDYNIPFDEKGTTVGTVRKVQWVKAGAEENEEKAKIEIRKMYINSDGEKTGKGYTFSTPEGPSELVHGLIDAGFGDTKEILKRVRKRDDFLEAAQHINDEEESSDSGDMFDMRDLLLGAEEEEEEAS